MTGYRIGLWQSRMGAGDGPVADGIVPLKTELLRQQDVEQHQIAEALEEK